MNFNNRFLYVFLLTVLFSASTLASFSKDVKFASKMKGAIEKVQQEAKKDPDTFKANVAQLEKEWGERTNPVEQSVVHALLGSAYAEMTWTSITDFDEETRHDYEQKRNEHFSHVLDDMEALADAKSSGYKEFMEEGEDAVLFENDMLSVMIAFVENEARWDNYRLLDAYEKVAQLYRMRGNQNACALMKLKAWSLRRRVEKKYGRISAEQYKDSVYQLLQEVKDEEVGADVALEYASSLSSRDEIFLFLQWAKENVAKSRCSKNLQNLEDMLCPEVQFHNYGKTVLLAGKPSTLQFEYWNCDRFTLTVRHYTGEALNKDGEKTLRENGAVVEEKEIVFGTDVKNAERKAKGLPVEGVSEAELTLPVGRYVLVAKSDWGKSVQEVRVTSLHVMIQEKDKENVLVYVVDNVTGRPVEGVKVQCRKSLPNTGERTDGWESQNAVQEVLTNAEGVAEVKANMQIRAVKDERDYTEYIKPSVWKNYVQENIQKTCRVMTDRGIYRPGQVLKGTVFVYNQEGVEAKVAAEESVVLKARDSQGKDVALLHLVTNEYGTASFELSLPEDCALGNLALQTEVAGQSSNTTVKVEEYKRPNFDVTLEGKKAGRFGQNLEVEGRAMLLAGVPLQGASVHYVVECVASPFRWWLGNDGEEWNQVAEGELVTGENGEFLIPLFLTDEYRKDDRSLVRFRVKALVTDMSGETHEGEWGINVSDEEYVLETDVANVVDLAKDGTFKVEAYNANREKVGLQGDFQILHADKVVATGRFKTNEKTELPEGLRLGVHYALVASVVDGRGRKVENRKEFIAYSSDLPATDFSALGFKEKFRESGDLSEEDFFVTGSLDFEEGGTVDLYFSTQETDAYIICNVYGIDGLIESYVAVTDGTMQHIRLQHRKEWGESIFIQMMYVRNGHFFSQSRTLVIAAPEKELKLEWATFRDKLQPGQQEQWRLTVTDRDGKRVSGAEMMAVLYDAALDRICPHDWYFRLYYYHPTPFSTCVHASGKFSWFGLDGTRQNATPYVRTFDKLRGFVHDRFVRGFGASAVFMGKSAGVDMALRGRIAGLQLNVLEENAVMTMGTEEEATMDFENAAIRNDFAETAFFLPHLVSDQDGVVDVQFTLPESLTEWRFLGFAHTKDVDYGTIKASAVARKNFMLRPNMPRFVRWGDGVVLSSSIVNQSELAQKGSVRLRLIDSGTGEVVFEEERPFFVEAAQTDVVEFEFEVREGWNDLDCEIVAVSGIVSDGEKNRLPVLSTKQEVVEAVPFYVMGVEDGAVEKTVNLSALYNGQSSTATNRDLKVEYTDNPVWMCIEALRSVQNPVNDNAIDFAVSLCANARLLNLMETFPMLEKYEDKEELRQRMQMAENKLFGLQQADGGWSWFKGMDGNYYITLAVCEMLSEMGTLNERVEEMLKQGMVFLDKREMESYRNRLRLGQEIISESAIRYLSLVASQPQRPVDRELQKMHRKYLSLLEKKRDALTIYGVAKAACLLRQFQREKSADKFVDLLKEYMVEKPGQGRFFASDAAYYSWMDYRIPTQVAAIKAISQRNRKDACLTDMVLWLVAQKQVQKWDNPLNAIDIAEVLLHISPTEMFFTAEMPRMSIDGVPLTRMEVGTINERRDELEGRDAELAMQGRVLAAVPAEMLDKGVDSLTISKATPGISWGAAYATFVEDIEQLKPYRTDELKIQRKIYVQSAAGGEWMVWKEGNSLHVGDRLKIRHMVSADRDMDFVKLSAQHPACLEPVRQLSGYQPLGGRSGYLSVRDAGFDVFFDKFTRGTSTVDVEYYIVREGAYEVGISTVECEYAKQFGGHTGGQKVKSIKK